MPQSVQIIPFFTQPHVHTVINDYTFYSEDVGKIEGPPDKPYSTMIVTGADKGIDNKFIKLSDINVKNELFGKSNFTKYGQPSLQADELLQTNQLSVWFMRVLPDNATYANMVVLAKYRRGKVLDENEQPTGMQRLEVKYELAYAAAPQISNGAMKASDIEAFGEAFISKTPDPLTGYMTAPLFYVRSTGRGKYGNNYALRVQRDVDFELDYDIKSYAFGVIENSTVTALKNVFVGSLVSTNRYNYSTLIDDTIDFYDEGTTPVKIHTYEKTMDLLYDAYQEVLAENMKQANASGTKEERTEIAELQSLEIAQFDPIFGLKLNTRNDEELPYLRIYTTQKVPYQAPDYVVSTKANLPLYVPSWINAFVGARVEVTKDESHSNFKYIYRIMAIDVQTGVITYDEGTREDVDAVEYNGINLALDIGHSLTGGGDGDFEKVQAGGIERAPSAGELKILLSREYVKAFRGEKDRYILSPMRIPLDFIFDANYNIGTQSEELEIDDVVRSIYDTQTILSDSDMKDLSVVESGQLIISSEEINVKGAMYDLNNFRNRNGHPISKDIGAGCHLHLDCGLVGLKNIEVNHELKDIIDVMMKFENRNTSVDLGYYTIIDPISGRKVNVTAAFFLARRLVPHIVSYGLNKPFVNNYAEIRGHVKNSFRPELDIIDWDVKEALYKSRINYYITVGENRYQRAVQNTCQRDASALLEESNVRVLNTLKKILEADCRGLLYEWNEPSSRQSYTDFEMDKFSPWIGTMVQSINIYFDANEYEQSHMMMHCYCDVSFRDIAKRIVLEIDITRPDYSSTGGEQ